MGAAIATLVTQTALTGQRSLPQRLLNVSYYLEKEGALVIAVRVQPRASRSQLEGIAEDRLRVRLSAPPVEGAANEACAALLAEVFGVPKRDVTLVRGHRAREKHFEIRGEPRVLLARLEAALTKK